jgi:hypothetical protein
MADPIKIEVFDPHKFTFDPQEYWVRSYLVDFLELPEEIVDDGELTKQELHDHGINNEVVNVTRFGNVLHPGEACKLFDLVEKNGKQAIHSLFRTDICPGKGVSAPQTILGNLFGRNSEPRSHGAIYSETACGFEQLRHFGLPNLVGIHFPEQTAPRSVAELGRAVFQIVNIVDNMTVRHASGVIVSNEGHLLTARHVLYNDQKKLKDDWYIVIGEEPIPISQEHVLWEGEGKDMVLLEVSALACLDHLKLAWLPPLPGEIVWVVGFPVTTSDEPDEDRFHTLGEVKNLHGDDLSDIETSAHTTNGYSGGAVINGRGELLGVLSQTFARSFVPMKVKVAIIAHGSTTVMHSGLYLAPQREQEFFLTVVKRLKEKKVVPEQWSAFHYRLKEEWLNANPSVFTIGKHLTDKEKATITRRLDKLIKE